MKPKSAVTVGATVVIALIVAGFLYGYLKHLNPNAYQVKVRFDDAKGILSQSVVRMQGVPIGEVSKIALDTKAVPPRPVLTLSIDKKFDIPADAKFVIIQGLLITTPQIEVRPNPNATSISYLPKDDTAQVDGAPSDSALSAISPDLQDTLRNLNKSFGQLNARLNKTFAKVDRLMDQTSLLVQNSNRTITSTREFLVDPKLKNTLQQTLVNFRDISQQTKETAQELSAQLKQVVQGSRGKLDKLSDTALNLANKLGDTIDNANNVVKKLTEQVSDPRLQQSLQETVELGRSTLASVRQIASDFHQLTGDPNLQANLKQTVENLKNTTEQSQETFKKVNSILDRVNNISTKKPKVRFPPTTFLANMSEQIDPARLRVDVEARLGLTPKTLLNIGFYDFGESTRLNLQAGTIFSGGWQARYGLYASKIGAGLDYNANSSTGLRFDLYDTNKPRLDVRGLIGVNKNASLWIGADSVFRRPVPVFGIQIKN